MAGFVVRKLTDLAITLVGVASLTFVVLRLTGDPVAMLLPAEATAQQVAETRRAMGLDAPLPQQYVSFLLGALRGDFGESFRYHEPAVDLVGRAIGPTLRAGGAQHAGGGAAGRANGSGGGSLP